jgi:hypothetical protein
MLPIDPRQPQIGGIPSKSTNQRRAAAMGGVGRGPIDPRAAARAREEQRQLAVSAADQFDRIDPQEGSPMAGDGDGPWRLETASERSKQEQRPIGQGFKQKRGRSKWCLVTDPRPIEGINRRDLSWDRFPAETTDGKEKEKFRSKHELRHAVDVPML